MSEVENEIEKENQNRNENENENETQNQPIAFIQDPFHLTSDAEFEEILEGVETAIEASQEQALAEALIETEESATQAQARLAQEIADDIALQNEIALEAQQVAESENLLDPDLMAALPTSGDAEEMQSCIETLLFLSDRPVSQKKLVEWLALPEDQWEILETALAALQEKYQARSHGIELLEIAGGWQLRTKALRAPLAKRLAKVTQQRLSSGAMETLAIIAYQQPVMKETVDEVRGVDSSHFIRGLLDRKLIRIAGRSELPGRPLVYETSEEFLEIFGLKDLAALPPLRELQQMIPGSESDLPEAEDPRVKEMRKLVSQMKADGSTSLKYDPKEDDRILQDIRDRVKQIPTSTPYLDEQKAAEKAAKEAALAASVETVLQPPLETAIPPPFTGAPILDEPAAL